MNREEAVWYYLLGKRTLGPVSWAEIEQITDDTVDADDLLVARGGDDEWLTASDVIEAEAEEARAVEEREAAERAREKHERIRTEISPGPDGVFPAVDGVGKWIGQAAQMVLKRIWVWIGALVLGLLTVTLTLGIAGPPLLVGLYMMALDRFRGRAVRATDVFRGFSRFLPAWGLGLAPLAVTISATILVGLILQSMGQSGVSETREALTVLVVLPMAALLLGMGAVLFYAGPLIADGRGAWEAARGSWTVAGADFGLHFRAMMLLGLILMLGNIACYVGLLVSVPIALCTQVAGYMYRFRDEQGRRTSMRPKG